MENQELATKVGQALDAQGRSLAWLAPRIKKDPSTLSRTLRGQDGHKLTLGLAEAIAHELQIPFEWLFGDTFDAEVKA